MAATTRGSGLPPGQRLTRTFPRFGLRPGKPIPAAPPNPVIQVRGAVAEPLDIPLTTLVDLPRQTVVADFHCVTGWTARGLRWEGIPVRRLYEEVIVPRARPAGAIEYLTFAGLDGFRTVLTLEDALADDVLIADRLDDSPLPGAHGAPARLVSPAQYGYKSTKHLCRIELHTTEPPRTYGSPLDRLLLTLVSPHRRARVAHEERHRHLPAWSLRFVYRLLVPPTRYLGDRGARRAGR